MQIIRNTTSMPAELGVAADKDGRDSWVVVVKGTFRVGQDGHASPAPEQVPFVYADAHHGDPGTTGIRHECDFALTKPHADVLVEGSAHAPGGRPVPELEVALEVGDRRKTIRVVGNRRWEKDGRHSGPVPFQTMPLVFEKAFGGSDHSHPEKERRGTELRNPVGLGFRLSEQSVVGASLPNLERPEAPVQKWSDAPAPIGFGVVGRNWLPRSRFAGTYDQTWTDKRFPFLPEDFDDRYFQSAPEDQWFPYFRGGEKLRCINMNPEHPSFEVKLPAVEVPVAFLFRDRDVVQDPNLDTVLLQPDRRRVVLCWRTSIPVGRKFETLRGVMVGRDRPETEWR